MRGACLGQGAGCRPPWPDLPLYLPKQTPIELTNPPPDNHPACKGGGAWWLALAVVGSMVRPADCSAAAAEGPVEKAESKEAAPVVLTCDSTCTPTCCRGRWEGGLKELNGGPRGGGKAPPNQGPAGVVLVHLHAWQLHASPRPALLARAAR